MPTLQLHFDERICRNRENVLPGKKKNGCIRPVCPLYTTPGGQPPMSYTRYLVPSKGIIGNMRFDRYLACI